MGYIGNKPPQETIPANDSVTEAMLKDNAVTSAKIAATTIVDADINASAAISNSKLETDPTNASNLSSGSVPLAQLGNAPATDLTPLESDIALLGFKVAANGSLGKYDLVDQTIDAFEDATGIDASASTNETRNSSGKYYIGEVLNTGTKTTYSSSGQSTHSNNSATTKVEIKMWGAGGGYNNITAAGGGFSSGTWESVPSSFYVSVGASGVSGGSQGASGGGMSGVWENTVMSTAADARLIAGGGGGSGREGGRHGGAGGGSSGQDSPSSSGGWGEGGDQSSGGSVGGSQFQGGSGNGAGGTPYGGGGSGYSGDWGSGGGGGGWFGGGRGENANGPHGDGGGGGSGYINTAYITSGVTTTGDTTTPANSSDSERGTSGDPSTDGKVIIQEYELTATNLTLVSNSTTAQATPTTGDIVMTYTNGAGTATVNTDIKAYVSRDNGTTYTQATLSSEGTTGGHTILTAHNVDISSQPSGTSMRYKITTHNQSASKETRIQAVSLGWS